MRRGGMSDRKLKKLVNKCRAMALSRGKSKSFSSSSVGCSISPRFSMRRSHSTFSYDSDASDDSCMSYASPPPDVPAGYLAVYVGRERRRFIIPTTYLGRPVFRPLLDQAAEEFGFDNKGALTIPCEVVLFKQVIRVLDLNDTDTTFDDLQFRASECGSEALHKGRHRSRIFSVLQRSLA